MDKFSARPKQEDSQERHPDCTPGLELFTSPSSYHYGSMLPHTLRDCVAQYHRGTAEISALDPVLSVPLHSPGNERKPLRVTPLTHYQCCRMHCTGSPVALGQPRCLALVDRAPQYCPHSLKVTALTWSWTGPVHRPRPACSSSWAGHRPRRACCSRGRTGLVLAFFYWSCWFPAGCCRSCRCSGG